MMTSKESIALTIRAATLGKTILSLVGVDDRLVAKVLLHQAAAEFRELIEFLWPPVEKDRSIKKG